MSLRIHPTTALPAGLKSWGADVIITSYAQKAKDREMNHRFKLLGPL